MYSARNFERAPYLLDLAQRRGAGAARPHTFGHLYDVIGAADRHEGAAGHRAPRGARTATRAERLRELLQIALRTDAQVPALLGGDGMSSTAGGPCGGERPRADSCTEEVRLGMERERRRLKVRLCRVGGLPPTVAAKQAKGERRVSRRRPRSHWRGCVCVQMIYT